MTTSRLATLCAVLAAGFSVVFLLPKQLGFQPVGIQLQLPDFVGAWYGTEQGISEKEIQVLGADTEFARKKYTNGRGDEIQVSIVLGGHDMNTSIHRPERCLPAQGWTIANKSGSVIAVPGFGAVPVTRLYDVRNWQGSEGRQITLYNLNYYWFVGHTDVTGSHFERTFIDVRDRLLGGYNQRWAYVTVTSNITDNLQKFGRNQEETDQLIREFIAKLVPLIHGESVRPPGSQLAAIQ